MDVIKIDTDGFDNAIIRGSKETLVRDYPLIFFEWMPDVLKERESPEEIFEYLHSVGYDRAMIYDNVGFLASDVDLSDGEALSAALARFYGHGVNKYADIAVFPKSKRDWYSTFVRTEINFFRNYQAAN